MRSGLATTDAALADAVRAIARPLASAAAPYRPLLELVGDARLVLLGAASHGTHEFYRERAEITKRLLGERDFTAVAIEGDWPAARRVDHYVRHSAGDRSASEALAGFQRFPAWLWRNADVVEFVEWLRAWNQARTEPADMAGFYGLDLYNLRASIEAVVSFPVGMRRRWRPPCAGPGSSGRSA